LAASRRDARLAALRLAGATTSQVTRLTALDAAGQALIGALIGIVGYFAIMPLIMLLNFQDQRFTFEQLWVGSLSLIVVLVVVTVLALISALLTLRRVAITPGRHRSDRPAAAHEVARNRVPGRAGGRDRAVQEPAGPAALR